MTARVMPASSASDTQPPKRVYFYPEQQLLLLQPENPAYKTIQIMGEDLERVKIIGKAVLAQISLK